MADVLSIFIPTLQFVLLGLSPFFYLILGDKCVQFLKGSGFLKSELRDLDEEIKIVPRIIIGLLFYLLMVFSLLTYKFSWPVATLVPYLPTLFPLNSIPKALGRIRLAGNLNFIIWFAVVLALGVSLFDYTSAIKTPWISNYADLAFHMGMLTSFVHGPEFYPDYHVYAGASLSYPFLINLWSASYWWMHPDYYSLSLIFTFQWTFIWTVIYFLLKGNRNYFLPWALLFAGGSYVLLGQKAASSIDSNAPWVVFLTSIWITQRSAMFGVMTCLTALKLFHSTTTSWSERTKRDLLSLSGLILAASTLVHSHIFLATALYIGGVLILRYILTKTTKLLAEENRTNFKHVLYFAIPGALSLIFLPIISGKASAIKLVPGWSTGIRPENFWHGIYLSSSMWFAHVWPWFVLIFVLWAVSKKHLAFIVLFILFILGNAVQIAYWNFDQLKFFIALYAIFLMLWADTESKSLHRFQFILLLLIIPALFTCFKLFKAGESFEVYSKKRIEIAEKIRSETPKDAIIAARPLHNSLVTLTGRRMFFGYDGTLWSHGLNYNNRRNVFSNLKTLADCKINYKEAPDFCPQYLVWTEEEKGFWKMDKPPKEFKPTKFSFLYEFPKN